MSTHITTTDLGVGIRVEYDIADDTAKFLKPGEVTVFQVSPNVDLTEKEEARIGAEIKALEGVHQMKTTAGMLSFIESKLGKEESARRIESVRCADQVRTAVAIASIYKYLASHS